MFLILVPVLTMRSLAEEQRQKTDQLLLTSPISVRDIVVGKYLGMLAVFGIACLVICVYPLIMSAYGEGFDDTTTLIVLSSSAIFSAVSNVVGSAIASRAKMWIGFIFNMIWAILVIAFTKIFLGMGYGALAIALSFLCSYILHTIISYVYLKVTLKNG
jgi:ABC-2 type transport system permease protein